MNWQRTNIQAAANYLRERIGAGAADVRMKAVYEGLLDVLEPTRRTVRMQRELAEAAKAAAAPQATRPIRSRTDRRQRGDRRVANLGPPGGVERRRVPDRRAGRDRRGGAT